MSERLVSSAVPARNVDLLFAKNGGIVIHARLLP